MSRHAVRLGGRSIAAIVSTTAIGIVAFGWPLLASPESTAVAHADDAPWLFVVVIPLLLAVVLAQFTDGGMDAKAVALLGVLAAVVAAMRPLGGGTAGLEPIWVILVLGGRALGPGFGFSLGAVALFSSALLTGGVGPWLPFQMLGAAWVGLGAGLLPRATGRAEIVLLAAYGAVAAFAYGLLMNLWFWPFTEGLPAAIAFSPGAPLSENLVAWLHFTIVTSLGYDIPRAVLTVVLIALAGPTILSALRRASRRANFGAVPVFVTEAQ
ncbi:MAG: ECF transporter S component [Candidatus Nanopelagicales bacterium]|nr:ECF transporter S component [Candidatus Nanopelagicales bacterium]